MEGCCNLCGTVCYTEADLNIFPMLRRAGTVILCLKCVFKLNSDSESDLELHDASADSDYSDSSSDNFHNT